MMSDLNKLKLKAEKILKKNTRTGFKDGKKYTFTVPAVRCYPFQWFWDSCFHAIVWTHFDIERAKDEIRSLLSWQSEDGFIPHIIFWNRKKVMTKPWHYFESKPWLVLPFIPTSIGKPKTSAMIQPPIIAHAVERIYEKGKDKAFLEEIFPGLVKYYKWLSLNRDRDKDGLISIIAPFEAGTDFNPVHDKFLGLKRPGAIPLFLKPRFETFLNKLNGYNLDKIFKADRFVVKDVSVNSYYINNLRVLAKLAEVIGDKKTAFWADKLAKKVLNSLLIKLYDKKDGIFFNLGKKDKLRSETLTIVSLIPLIIHDLPKNIVQKLVENYLLNPDKFWLPYPIPSIAKDEPEFRPDGKLMGLLYDWRGSAWVNTNWFLFHALKHHGFPEVANTLKEKTIKMVTRNGFHEKFNPITGEGIDAKDFGWSTLVIDM